MKRDFAETLVELLTPGIRDSVRKSMNELVKDNRIEPPVENDLMFIDETAELIGMKKSSLYSNICRGLNHPPCTRRGGRLYFSRHEVIQWIQSGQKK